MFLERPVNVSQENLQYYHAAACLLARPLSMICASLPRNSNMGRMAIAFWVS